ncbi:MAG: hypothetical protein IPG77_25030 [Betaproteobacteria bacterium]|nr:hypothetical protein [Betaproteobacteria bacterium]
MTTKTITLRAIDLLPGLGNDHDGIPFRWLTSFVEKVKAQVPDDEEASAPSSRPGADVPLERTLCPKSSNCRPRLPRCRPPRRR